MRPRTGEGGFALLDALLALAIFGIITGMFVETVNSTALARRHTALSQQAILVAQSRLALAEELDEFGPSGRDGAFAWRSEVMPYPGGGNGHELEKVTVIVSDPVSGRTLTSLSSLRLAR